MNNVGGCQPMYGVYTQIHNTICRNFLDGLVRPASSVLINLWPLLCLYTFNLCYTYLLMWSTHISVQSEVTTSLHLSVHILSPPPSHTQNGFWWSLGFCSFLFVPVVIFAVLTSSFFLKKKSADGDNDGYLDYPWVTFWMILWPILCILFQKPFSYEEVHTPHPHHCPHTHTTTPTPTHSS